MAGQKMIPLEEIGQRAVKASREMNRLGVLEKNKGLEAVAAALEERRSEILDANAVDVEAAGRSGMKESLIDRLTLTDERLEDDAAGTSDRTETGTARSYRHHL